MTDSPGFFDLPDNQRPCIHPEHNPPMGLYIPPGKGYRHVCPGCGCTQTLIPQQIDLRGYTTCAR